ncbi:MAG: transposase [Actinobacteria bacterium]|nr:transposase [Actinomycetota bacterium]
MVDVDTFLTTLYVIVDDFCQSRAPRKRPGPKAALSDSEVVALAIFARWGRFSSERDFFRYAQSRLREAFPTLPDRSQFNRLVRSCVGLIEEVALHLLALMPDAQGGGGGAYEALDASAMPVRNAKRRGEGWLAGYADIGWSNSLGWYEGFCLLVAVAPTGVITGFGFASASTKDQPLAETFFALRAQPDPRLQSVGSAASGPYVLDKGFEGGDNHRRWRNRYGARVICSPKRNGRKRKWPKRLRRWAASIRQIVESVFEKLHDTFGLRGERPHELSGLRARLAARVALHNFCIWLNEQLGRPRLSFADLLGW